LEGQKLCYFASKLNGVSPVLEHKMTISKENLFEYASEVTEALTEAYAANHELSKKSFVLSGLSNLVLGLFDVAINGYKANSPLLGLYQLFQANRPKPKLAEELRPELAPRLEMNLPKPRPY
jgi:hypothetical protein